MSTRVATASTTAALRRSSAPHAPRARVVRVRACRECASSSTSSSSSKSSSLLPRSLVRSRSHALAATSREPKDDASTSGREDEHGPDEDTASMKIAMGLLDFYKREVSPLLPKSCRYVPTCSEYARQAYKKYGTSKGFVLTAWRLLRCNPLPLLGGSGYDPPMWPPPYLGSDPAEL